MLDLVQVSEVTMLKSHRRLFAASDDFCFKSPHDHSLYFTLCVHFCVFVSTCYVFYDLVPSIALPCVRLEGESEALPIPPHVQLTVSMLILPASLMAACPQACSPFSFPMIPDHDSWRRVKKKRVRRQQHRAKGWQ